MENNKKLSAEDSRRIRIALHSSVIYKALILNNEKEYLENYIKAKEDCEDLYLEFGKKYFEKIELSDQIFIGIIDSSENPIGNEDFIKLNKEVKNGKAILFNKLTII